MTKITSNISSELVHAINDLAPRLINQRSCEVTPHQLLTLCLPPSDYDTLERAAQLMGYRTAVQYKTQVDLSRVVQLPEGVTLTQPMADLALSMAAGKAVQCPPKLTPVLTNASEPMVAFLDFLNWRVRLAVQVATARLLVKRFEEKNLTLEQLRFAMPMTLVLCKQREYLAKYVERLQDYKAPKVLPPMTPRLRELCRDANEIIAAASMFEPMPSRTTAPVEITGLGMVNIDGLGSDQMT